MPVTTSIIQFLGNQPLMRVVRGLLHSPQPRHLRALAVDYSLSPSGLSDILRRLDEAGVLHESRSGNRRLFALKITAPEYKVLEDFFKQYEIAFIESRAPLFERRAVEKLAWMDEAYEFYRGVKKKRNDPA